MTSISSRPRWPAFAGVRIEPADEDARRGDAEARAQIAVDDAQHSLQQLAR